MLIVSNKKRGVLPGETDAEFWSEFLVEGEEELPIEQVIGSRFTNEEEQKISQPMFLKGGDGSGVRGHTTEREPKEKNQIGHDKPVTKDEKSFNDLMSQMRDMMEGKMSGTNFKPNEALKDWKYKSLYGMVLQEGKWCTPAPRPDDVPKMRDKECFKNAAQLAFENSKYTYVEGFANSGIIPFPMAHAWCVDDKGRTVDPTWKTPGEAYIGIPFNTDFVRETVVGNGHWGIIPEMPSSKYNPMKDGWPDRAIKTGNSKKDFTSIDFSSIELIVKGNEGK